LAFLFWLNQTLNFFGLRRPLVSFSEAVLNYAISTMLHYVILLVGFFMALGALGIDLTKITIVAGAFSVGVGFGLQTIFNNFVSGIILLFERPIKIGDIIEVAGTAGEVQPIGIRASVIRTAEGSEIIVPNGMLISSQVTNWTFTDRRRAVEVSVAVIFRLLSTMRCSGIKLRSREAVGSWSTVGRCAFVLLTLDVCLYSNHESQLRPENPKGRR
jgi:small-conductance mechanosensitive channel